MIVRNFVIFSLKVAEEDLNLEWRIYYHEIIGLEVYENDVLLGD